MQQLELFGDITQHTVVKPAPLDSGSEALLATYRQRRLAEGGNLHTMARDVSQLRSLVRSSQALGGPDILKGLWPDPRWIAHILCQPPDPVSRSTVRARLLAAQRFTRVMGPVCRCDLEEWQHALDQLLPARLTAVWHNSGIALSGDPRRRRERAPTLEMADLLAIVRSAGGGKRSPLALRDQTIVGLLCFSGIHAGELLGLTQNDVLDRIAAPGVSALSLLVTRHGTRRQLPVVSEAETLLRAWLAHLRGMQTLGDPLFCRQGPSHSALTYGSLRSILQAACKQARLPQVETSDLRAALAFWLRTQGLTDHQIKETLGVARVKSVDDLLRRPNALEAQRSVRRTVEI